MSNYLPKGFRDYMLDGADLLHEAAEKVAGVYARWGFRRFIPSAIEDADTFGQGADLNLLQQSFRFPDRTGDLLVLRSDMTLQAARVLSGELAGATPPLRLFYADRVFRHVPEGQGRLREVWQAGVELAGVSGPEADAEIIAVTLDALREVGVTDVQVDIGHAAFVREFLTALNLAPDVQHSLASALERKDARGLLELRESGLLSPDHYTQSLALIEAFGLSSLDEVERAGFPVSADAVAQLRGIITVLETYGVDARFTFDPGEIRGFDYYTGFFFHVYSSEVGRPLAAGGRYDGLLKEYGRDLDAVGCAIDLAAVLPSLPVVDTKRIHIVNLRDARDDALRLAREFRNAGACVSREIIRRSWEETLVFARKLSIDWIVVLEQDGMERVVRVADEKDLSIADLRGKL